MATREKKKVITGVTAEGAQEASAAYTTAHVRQMQIEAKMNEQINKIKAKYQDEITELAEEKDGHFEILEVYAKEQKDNWGKKKSMDLLNATIGFRTGTPKLKCDKGFNWTSVTSLLKEHYPDYVRTVDEPNKEKLIADRDNDGFDKICKKSHVSIVQDETFYVEPKIEEVITS
jgi:phage host-nuclease inhibitor protein Gam